MPRRPVPSVATGVDGHFPSTFNREKTCFTKIYFTVAIFKFSPRNVCEPNHVRRDIIFVLRRIHALESADERSADDAERVGNSGSLAVFFPESYKAIKASLCMVERKFERRIERWMTLNLENIELLFK